jgi:hypothetical protein
MAWIKWLGMGLGMGLGVLAVVVVGMNAYGVGPQARRP